MSDWVIPLVALVPAILTALSGLLQPALKSRSDSRAAQAAADRERFVSRYDDAVALLCDSYARMSEVDRGDSFWRFFVCGLPPPDPLPGCGASDAVRSHRGSVPASALHHLYYR